MTTPQNDHSRIAVVYFSYSGRTQIVAKIIRHLCGADLFRVIPQQPYPADWDNLAQTVKTKLETPIIRAVRSVAIDLNRYDTVILSTPTWWHHTAQPLMTWLQTVDLSGKRILTCNTHDGGGLMHTREDFENALPHLTLGTHLTLLDKTVEEAEPFIKNWLTENGVLTVR